MRLRARHYRTGAIVDIVYSNGHINPLQPPNERPADAEASWVAPAFCDVQINGCSGLSFGAALTCDQIHAVVSTCRRHGISELCPTLITASADELLRGFRALHE